MKPEPDELELAIRARSGDQEALAELIERLRVGLFALAYAELRHYQDAQDAVAAALYQICCHAVDLRDPASMRAWMYTIVRNETHRMRRGKPAGHMPLDEATDIGDEDPSPLLRLDIERALRQLPRDQAHAVSLFYLQGWSIVEIARHLARPVGTIKYWLHQGRRRLATEMKGYSQMEKTWKACIVAPEITPAQLLCVTDALKGAGYADVQNVAEVRSLDDLYYLSKDVSRSLAEPGLSVEEKNRRLHTLQLADPLASCDFLILGERIAKRSAFELIPVIRAIARQLSACILIEQPYTDSTILASYCTGFDLCLTSDAPSHDLQHFFSLLRTSIEPTNAPH